MANDLQLPFSASRLTSEALHSGSEGRFSRDLVPSYLHAGPSPWKPGIPEAAGERKADPSQDEVVFIIGCMTEILFGSSALLPSLGYTPHELHGTKLIDLMNSVQAGELLELLGRIDTRTDMPTSIQVELRHKAGPSRLLVGSARAISGEGFGRSYVMRVRPAALPGRSAPSSGSGRFFRKVLVTSF